MGIIPIAPRGGGIPKIDEGIVLALGNAGRQGILLKGGNNEKPEYAMPSKEGINVLKP